MAALSRPVCRHARLDLDDDPPAREIPSVPEIAAVSATICDFMNKERLRDLALYIVRFGSKFVCGEQFVFVCLFVVVSCTDASMCFRSPRSRRMICRN